MIGLQTKINAIQKGKWEKMIATKTNDHEDEQDDYDEEATGIGSSEIDPRLKIVDTSDALHKLLLFEEYAERAKSKKMTKHILELRTIIEKQTVARSEEKKNWFLEIMWCK